MTLPMDLYASVQWGLWVHAVKSEKAAVLLTLVLMQPSALTWNQVVSSVSVSQVTLDQSVTRTLMTVHPSILARMAASVLIWSMVTAVTVAPDTQAITARLIPMSAHRSHACMVGIVQTC